MTSNKKKKSLVGTFDNLWHVHHQRTSAAAAPVSLVIHVQVWSWLYARFSRERANFTIAMLGLHILIVK